MKPIVWFINHYALDSQGISARTWSHDGAWLWSVTSRARVVASGQMEFADTAMAAARGKVIELSPLASLVGTWASIGYECSRGGHTASVGQRDDGEWSWRVAQDGDMHVAKSGLASTEKLAKLFAEEVMRDGSAGRAALAAEGQS